MTRDDFSDDDDNVPLKLLKEDEVSEPEERGRQDSDKEDDVDAKSDVSVAKSDRSDGKNDGTAAEAVDTNDDIIDAKNDVSDSESNVSESESDSDSDDSYNNPERLWCICRKPHNNRLMTKSKCQS